MFARDGGPRRARASTGRRDGARRSLVPTSSCIRRTREAHPGRSAAVAVPGPTRAAGRLGRAVPGYRHRAETGRTPNGREPRSARGFIARDRSATAARFQIAARPPRAPAPRTARLTSRSIQSVSHTRPRQRCRCGLSTVCYLPGHTRSTGSLFRDRASHDSYSPTGHKKPHDCTPATCFLSPLQAHPVRSCTRARCTRARCTRARCLSFDEEFRH